MNQVDAAFIFKPDPFIYDTVMGPLYFRPYAIDAAKRIAGLQPGSLLETACGTGILTRELEKGLPVTTQFVATDYSEEMLAYARKHAVSPHTTWQAADATALPFDNASFDAVVCQFGAMFFPDKVKGFAEAWRVLSPGGTFMFSTWDSLANNPLAEADRAVFIEFFSGKTPANLFTAFSMHDPELVCRQLAAAGFENIKSEVLVFPCLGPPAPVLAEAILQGGSIRYALRDAGPEDRAILKKHLSETLQAKFGSPVKSRLQAFLFTAVKPPSPR